MEWIETRVTFKSADTQTASELIAEIFQELGTNGVLFEDPELLNEDKAVPANKQRHNAVTGYFPDDNFFKDNIKKLKERLTSLKKNNSMESDVLSKKIFEKDWSEAWKEFFKPEKISKNIVVKPSWHEFSGQAGDIIIEIDPGMAFGTGTHPTTVLCVNAIEKYIKPASTVLDIGTGSGILLIAAAKLGAGHMVGIDIDELAVKIAKKNMLRNRIDPKQFIIKKGSLADVGYGKFDIVVANIVHGVILKIIDHVENFLSKDGIFICSGILQEQKKLIEDKIIKKGFKIIETGNSQEWTMIAGKKHGK